MLLGLLVPFAGSPAFAQTKGATASADVATYMKVNASSNKLFREIFSPPR